MVTARGGGAGHPLPAPSPQQPGSRQMLSRQVPVGQVQSSPRARHPHRHLHTRQTFCSASTPAGRGAPSRAGCPAAQRQQAGEEGLPTAGHSSSAKGRGSGCSQEPDQRPGLGWKSLPLRFTHWELTSTHTKCQGGSSPPSDRTSIPHLLSSADLACPAVPSRDRLPASPLPTPRAVLTKAFAPQPGRSCLGKMRVSAPLVLPPGSAAEFTAARGGIGGAGSSLANGALCYTGTRAVRKQQRFCPSPWWVPGS